MIMRVVIGIGIMTVYFDYSCNTSVFEKSDRALHEYQIMNGKFLRTQNIEEYLKYCSVAV